jgi:hypothetical protein
MFALFCATLLLGCSKDDEPKNIDKEVEAITQVLNGEFIGSLYSSVTNTTETEELVFTPYSSTKEMMSVIDGKVEVYGTAIVTKYTNDHLLETTQNCYYSVRVAYTGAQPTVSFYPYSSSGDINDTEDKRIITILSNSSFKMRDYGLTENNDKTYTKQ